MKDSRLRLRRRADRVRAKIRKVSGRPRLSVHRSGRHIYAQIIDDNKSITIAHASTLDQSIRKKDKSSMCNVEHAVKVGQLIAERAKRVGLKFVVFDKGGASYHGIVRTVAEAARHCLDF